MREAQLQSKIRKDLERHGYYVVKIHICNKPGFPDLLIMNSSNVKFLEIKSKGKKPEPLQLHRHGELKKMHYDVFVIDTWEKYLEVREKL